MPPSHERTRSHGFTLTELLITLAITAMLAAASIPSLSRLLARTNSADAATAIVNTLRHARTAAIMHNRRTVACPSVGGHDCDDSSEWQHGWIIVTDANHDDHPDAGTVVIAAFPALPAANRIITSTGRRLVAFQPNGTAAGSNASFTICNVRIRTGHAVIVANSGRVRLANAQPTRLKSCLAGMQR